jgi:hypothetical protein
LISRRHLIRWWHGFLSRRGRRRGRRCHGLSSSGSLTRGRCTFLSHRGERRGRWRHRLFSRRARSLGFARSRCGFLSRRGLHRRLRLLGRLSGLLIVATSGQGESQNSPRQTTINLFHDTFSLAVNSMLWVNDMKFRVNLGCLKKSAITQPQILFSIRDSFEIKSKIDFLYHYFFRKAKVNLFFFRPTVTEPPLIKLPNKISSANTSPSSFMINRRSGRAP